MHGFLDRILCCSWSSSFWEDLKVHMLLFCLFYALRLNQCLISFQINTILFPLFHKSVKIPALMINTEIREWHSSASIHCIVTRSVVPVHSIFCIRISTQWYRWITEVY